MLRVERMRPLLGTFVTIRADATSALTAMQLEAAVQSAFRAVERVGQLMSFHSKSSDVGRLNRGQSGKLLRVHLWTYAVLGEAVRLRQLSRGAFDCNVGASLMRAGLLPKSLSVARHVRRSRASPRAEISLCSGNKIKLNTSVSLDLGGIAKGFAVDKAVEILRSRGVSAGLVNAGGDMRVFGEHAEPVWVRCLHSPTELQFIGRLTNGAIATSAAYFTDDKSGHAIGASAIVDTAKVRRVVMANSVSVLARTCMQADALTKIAVVKGRLPTSLARNAQARAIKL